MKSIMHALAGIVALGLISSFWLASLISELFLTQQAIVWVKQSILYAMPLLIPALMLSGASGFFLAKKRMGRLVTKKQKRMPIIAFNGLVFLLPLAIYLYAKAVAAEFDVYFYTAQSLELLVGAVNMSLMALNIRDGFRLKGRPIASIRPIG